MLYLPQYDKESSNVGPTLAKQVKFDPGKHNFAELLKFNHKHVFSPTVSDSIKMLVQLPVIVTEVCECKHQFVGFHYIVQLLAQSIVDGWYRYNVRQLIKEIAYLF